MYSETYQVLQSRELVSYDKSFSNLWQKLTAYTARIAKKFGIFPEIMS